MPQYVCVASFSEVGDALASGAAIARTVRATVSASCSQDLVGEAARQGFSLAQCL